jgi:glycosyltransferase involved in cell wall biosynthesis
MLIITIFENCLEKTIALCTPFRKMPRNIYINARFLSRRSTGVQKYALGLCRSYAQSHPEVIFLGPAGHYDDQGLNVKRSLFFSGNFWEQCILPLLLLFKKNVLLINLCNTAPLLVKRQLVTIHDLAVFRQEAWFSSAFRRWYRFLLPRICRRSLGVITVSEHIRNEICERFKIDAKKITVIPNGLPEIHCQENTEHRDAYLLLIDVFNPRKNADFVLSHASGIAKHFRIYALGTTNGIFGKAAMARYPEVHWCDYVEEAEYYSLLKEAHALIYPSFYEGFGIPVLEALYLGTTVILPDRAEYRALFGDAPLYYKEGDDTDLIEKINSLPLKRVDKSPQEIWKNSYNFERSARLLEQLIQTIPY